MDGPESLAIAFLSHAASPDAPTGAERSLSLLAEGMRRRGHRVAIVAPGSWSLESAMTAAGVELVCIPCRACWLTYYEPRPWPVAALKWARWAWPQHAASRIASWLGSWGADVVHVNCLPHLRGAAAAARSGRPTVWHLREILPPGARRRWFATAIRRHATRVVAVSEAVGAWVRDEGLGERLSIVRNGVDPPGRVEEPGTARRALGLPADGVLFGLFGQLAPHKGALDFVEAARRTLETTSDARFVIAGAGPRIFRDRVRDAIRATGRGERFHLLEPQAGSERLLAATDVACLTTRTPDPLPRAVLEAMAHARPVVAYRSGGTAEMVGDGTTGLMVDTGDVKGLAAAMARLAQDPESRAAMGQAGARLARERFTVEAHLDAMETMFRGLVR